MRPRILISLENKTLLKWGKETLDLDPRLFSIETTTLPENPVQVTLHYLTGQGQDIGQSESEKITGYLRGLGFYANPDRGDILVKRMRKKSNRSRVNLCGDIKLEVRT